MAFERIKRGRELSAYSELMEILANMPKQSMLNAFKLDAQVNGENTLQYEAGKWRVFITNSCYVGDNVLDIKGKLTVYVSIIKNVVVLGLQHRFNEFDIEALKALVDVKFLDKAYIAITTGIDLGQIHLKQGKRYTLWNFHSGSIRVME